MFVDLERALHSTRGIEVEPSGIVRVGALATVGVYRLTSIAASLTTKHPKLEVHLQYGLMRELLEALRRGHLDAAAGVGDPPSHGLEVKMLGHARPVLITRRRLALKARSTLDDLRRLSWASFGPVDDRFFGRVWEFMRGHRLDECVRVRVAHIQTLMELVRTSDHAAIVPDYTVNSPELAKRSLRGLAFEEPIWLAVRGLENPAVRALFSEVADPKERRATARRARLRTHARTGT
jgi:DNA-binding transcriptional LysR family regulator